MAQILELLGDMPRSLALSGKYSHEMFNRRGEWQLFLSPRYIPSIGRSERSMPPILCPAHHSRSDPKLMAK